MTAFPIESTYLNEIAVKIYSNNCTAGWWDNPNRCLFECLQLISTEVAEATEGARKNLMDDHLPHRWMEEVELADALIRTLDLGGRLGLLHSYHFEGLPTFDATSSVGRLHLILNSFIIPVAEEIEVMQSGADNLVDLEHRYSDLITMIIAVSVHRNYDIKGAMEEKIEYNTKRADHKRENRALENGKKF